MPLLKNLLLFCLSLGFAQGQIVKIIPELASANDEIEILFDASQGTAGLKGASSVYMHSGVVISGPNGTAWEYVVGNWGKDDGLGKMSKVDGEENLWSIKIANVREYYGVPEDILVFRLSMVFRNADGSKEGKGNPGAFDGGLVANNQDIYLDLNVDNYVQLIEPSRSLIYFLEGELQSIQARASSKADVLSLYIDEGKAMSYLKVCEMQILLNRIICQQKTRSSVY